MNVYLALFIFKLDNHKEVYYINGYTWKLAIKLARKTASNINAKVLHMNLLRNTHFKEDRESILYMWNIKPIFIHEVGLQD